MNPKLEAFIAGKQQEMIEKKMADRKAHLIALGLLDESVLTKEFVEYYAVGVDLLSTFVGKPKI